MTSEMGVTQADHGPAVTATSIYPPSSSSTPPPTTTPSLTHSSSAISKLSRVSQQAHYDQQRALELAELREKGFEPVPVDAYDTSSVNVVDRSCAESHLLKVVCTDEAKRRNFYATQTSVHSLSSQMVRDKLALFSCRCARVHYSTKEPVLNHIALKHTSQSYFQTPAEDTTTPATASTASTSATSATPTPGKKHTRRNSVEPATTTVSSSSSRPTTPAVSTTAASTASAKKARRDGRSRSSSPGGDTRSEGTASSTRRKSVMSDAEPTGTATTAAAPVVSVIASPSPPPTAQQPLTSPLSVSTSVTSSKPASKATTPTHHLLSASLPISQLHNPLALMPSKPRPAHHPAVSSKKLEQAKSSEMELLKRGYHHSPVLEADVLVVVNNNTSCLPVLMEYLSKMSPPDASQQSPTYEMSKSGKVKLLHNYVVYTCRCNSTSYTHLGNIVKHVLSQHAYPPIICIREGCKHVSQTIPDYAQHLNEEHEKLEVVDAQKQRQQEEMRREMLAEEQAQQSGNSVKQEDDDDATMADVDMGDPAYLLMMASASETAASSKPQESPEPSPPTPLRGLLELGTSPNRMSMSSANSNQIMIQTQGLTKQNSSMTKPKMKLHHSFSHDPNHTYKGSSGKTTPQSQTVNRDRTVNDLMRELRDAQKELFQVRAELTIATNTIGQLQETQRAIETRHSFAQHAAQESASDSARLLAEWRSAFGFLTPSEAQRHMESEAHKQLASTRADERSKCLAEISKAFPMFLGQVHGALSSNAPITFFAPNPPQQQAGVPTVLQPPSQGPPTLPGASLTWSGYAGQQTMPQHMAHANMPTQYGTLPQLIPWMPSMPTLVGGMGPPLNTIHSGSVTPIHHQHQSGSTTPVGSGPQQHQNTLAQAAMQLQKKPATLAPLPSSGMYKARSMEEEKRGSSNQSSYMTVSPGNSYSSVDSGMSAAASPQQLAGTKHKLNGSPTTQPLPPGASSALGFQQPPAPSATQITSPTGPHGSALPPSAATMRQVPLPMATLKSTITPPLANLSLRSMLTPPTPSPAPQPNSAQVAGASSPASATNPVVLKTTVTPPASTPYAFLFQQAEAAKSALAAAAGAITGTSAGSTPPAATSPPNAGAQAQQQQQTMRVEESPMKKQRLDATS